jgi:polyhydroxybutyrate depolymerase
MTSSFVSGLPSGRISRLFFACAGAAAAALVSLPLACSSSDAAVVPPPAATTTEAPIPGEDAATPVPPEKDASPAEIESKGCAVAPAGIGAVTRKQTTAAAKQRVYHLDVPAGVRMKQKLPLVFILHGAGDTNAQNMKDWFGVAGKMNAALGVYPQALPRTRSDGTGGNVTRWDLTGNEDLAFFDAMLEEISDAYCVDRAHVFVTGFSSGGNFSQNLACLRQKDVKGMAVVAGPGPFSDNCGGAVPVWMTHDADDMGLPVKDARSSRDFWASQNGCGKSTWTAVAGRPECQRNTSCPAGEPLVYCETTGVGHQVPDFAIEAIGGFFESLRP